ncbi:MAG: hypothetical protein WA924_10475 [Burkholderiaceae bacterium]
MKKYLSVLAALTMGMALSVPAAHAETAAGKAAPKAATKKAPAKKAAKTPPVSQEDLDDPEPDVSNSIAVDYVCELGNKLTILANAADEQHVALRWKNRLIRLERVGTTTGAMRFESKKRGLVWIGIPAKGILLDSRRGQQLANECKNPQQLALKTSDTPAGSGLLAPQAPPPPIAAQAGK